MRVVKTFPHGVACLAVLIGLFPMSMAAASPPKLAVMIVIDQFRADYLVRFAPYFSSNGLGRLIRDGYQFDNCHYRHAFTQTAAGHATLSSGAYPNKHGIVANQWLDRATWQIVNAVEDQYSPLVGAKPLPHSPGQVLEMKSHRSPANLLITTVGDQLKIRFGDKSKVVSISGKDRSAILLGGKMADAVYWWDRGRFVTSRYYADSLPQWVVDFNRRGLAEARFNESWDRMLEAPIYDAVQGADDAVGESGQYGFGRTFPKKLDGGNSAITPAFYRAFDVSPFASELLGTFAEQAIIEEKLGGHAAADLLCISFSQIDAVGHAYGPDSHEMMDSVLRLDRVIGSLFNLLEKAVGLENCVFVLSADHGVCPLPERVGALRGGEIASRFDGAKVDRLLEAALNARYGQAGDGEFWFTRDNTSYYLHDDMLVRRGISGSDIGSFLCTELLKYSQIAAAYTAVELADDTPSTDPIKTMLRRSYLRQRSGDVIFVTQPFVVHRGLTGSSHGMPYNYNTHVPLVWFGHTIATGRSAHQVGVEDVAPTLASILQISPPPKSSGVPLSFR